MSEYDFMDAQDVQDVQDMQDMQAETEALMEQQFFDRLRKNAQRLGHVLQRSRSGYLLYPAQGSTLHLGDLNTVAGVLRHIKVEQRQEPTTPPLPATATPSLAGWLG